MSETTICDRLLDLMVDIGLDRDSVQSIAADPHELTVTVYDKAPGGGPFLEVMVHGKWVPFNSREHGDMGEPRIAVSVHRYPLFSSLDVAREMSS